MYKGIKAVLFAAMLSVFVIGGTITAFAKETIVTNLNVSLKEKSSEEAGVPYPVNVSASRSKITEISTSKPREEWNAGETITISITLEPINGYVYSHSKTKVKVDGGSLASSDIKSTYITLRINYKPHMQLLPPENLWMSEDQILHWDKVPKASGYKVNLKGKGLSKTLDASKTSIDLSRYITSEDPVTIKVSAVPSKATSAYLKQSAWNVYGGDVEPGDNTEYGVFTGDIAHLRFRVGQSSGSATTYASGWQHINGSWYYFGANYYAQRGWQLIDGKWYYLDPDTATMKTGWVNLNGIWYYLSESTGEMKKGWVQTSPNGPMYYLDINTGAMWCNAVTPDGSYVGADGARVTQNAQQQPANGTNAGFYDANGKRFYRLTNGTNAADCWQLVDGYWYYFGKDGVALTGWQWIDGNRDGIAECYYLSPADNGRRKIGAMYANTTTPDGYTVDGNGAWTVGGKIQQKRVNHV